jgi:dTDP-4-amino-4,6-dideoxygalactose transaminase
MAAYAALPDSRRRIGDVAVFFWNYVMAPWTQTPSYYFARLFGSSSQSNDPKFEMTTKINSNMAAVALEQLKSLELRISGRRRVADLYHRKVDPQQAIAFPQYAPQRFLTRIVLTLPGGVNIDKVRADLVRRGIRTRGGYPVFTSELRPRPQRALSLRPRLIELPSRSGMSANTVDKIWDAFAACVGSLDPAAG